MSGAPLSRPIERLAAIAGLDRAGQALARVTAGRDGTLVAAARGYPLGHPAHPALTDLPIGFWTAAMLLDLVGGRRAAAPAQSLVGWGLVSAVPSIATGVADAPRLGPGKRRVAVVHAASNAVATGAYAASWMLRRRGRHAAGVLTGVGGAAAASIGGYLGGWLALAEEPDGAGRAGSVDPDVVERLAEQVADALGGRQVATAESCTAGRVATALASVSSAVDFFAGSLVGYREDIKRAHLGVGAESVYSEEAAGEMARGACRLFDTAVAVATSGVVGDDPEDGVAPGTVFIATAVDGTVRANRYRYDGTPAERCERARDQALRDLATALAAG
ncbi:MAG TPA: nicotinamide-nucleotide amidohydrolase family protein [Ilumatobacter sp.]|nr:nicotinamide-nucleotide amidohydrolase family protein [Ilumatobacter sp.]